jgi:PAS domain S-box-containing protein
LELHKQKREIGIKRRGLVLFAGWTLIIVISFSWNLWYSTTSTYEIAKNNLRLSIEKDLLFRSWATDHNGIYVHVTDKTPPNPYLTHMPERDIITTTGRQLTLMNPAYMMRELYELSKERQGVHGRLVSIEPVNPINMADEWESAALMAFSEPGEEAVSTTEIAGQAVLRIIKPFYVEEGCLYCHTEEGFKIGDLRGGISTTLSLEPYLAVLSSTKLNLIIGYIVIWLLGTGGIFIATMQLDKVTRLRISEEKYRTIVENTNDALLIHDFNGKILDLNERASKMYGFERSELIGANLSKVTSMESSLQRSEIMEQLMQANSLVFEGVDIRRDGQQFPVEISAKIVSKQGNGVIQVFVRDISERKQAEIDMREANSKLAKAIVEAQELAVKAEEANSAKSKFLSNMSHEIRTPMNAVVGMTELLEELSDNNEQKKYIDILKKNGENLLSLINNILDLSKMEAGSMEVKMRESIVCNILKEIGLNYQPLAAKKGLEITIDTGLCHPKQCCALIDEDKLRQVLINLVGNAIKYTESGTIDLSFRILDEAKMLFVVKDTGIGIAGDKLDDIFHAFKQGDVSNTQTYAGTGLGLTISKKLVELMEGQIWVESELGVGSKFSFILPYKPINKCLAEKCDCHKCPELISKSKTTYNQDIDEENTDQGNNREGLIDNNMEGKIDSDKDVVISNVAKDNDKIRVLLAEDTADNRYLVMAYLKKENIQIDVVNDGKQAVEKYQEVASDTSQKQYSVILMDIQMPITDGYQATKIIREWEQANKIQPVVIYALTAYALNEERQKSIKAGCSGHLTKPIRKQQLIDVINSHRD